MATVTNRLLFTIFSNPLLFTLADDASADIGVLLTVNSSFLFLASNRGFVSTISDGSFLSLIASSISFAFVVFGDSFLFLIAGSIGSMSAISGSSLFSPIVDDSSLFFTVDNVSPSVVLLALSLSNTLFHIYCLFLAFLAAPLTSFAMPFIEKKSFDKALIKQKVFASK